MNTVSQIAEGLRVNTEAFCRRYLFNGHVSGRYWMVGNVMNEKGQSMHVRLLGPSTGPNARGKWSDEATGEFGDLLDILKHQNGNAPLSDILTEARSFLALPHPPSGRLKEGLPDAHPALASDQRKTIERALRLFRRGQSIQNTIAEAYLQRRRIIDIPTKDLRFHPNVYYRDKTGVQCQPPALLAAIRDHRGTFKGLNKIWLESNGCSVADIPYPKKVQGALLGNAVWFGTSNQLLLVGEGMETVLSLKTVRPDIAMAAALTANQLAAFDFPKSLQYLVIARDNDPAGLRAAQRLSQRASKRHTSTLIIRPRFGDFNDDLKHYGPDYMKQRLTDILNSHVLAA